MPVHHVSEHSFRFEHVAGAGARDADLEVNHSLYDTSVYFS
jgi:hypothetical protein